MVRKRLNVLLISQVEHRLRARRLSQSINDRRHCIFGYLGGTPQFLENATKKRMKKKVNGSYQAAGQSKDACQVARLIGGVHPGNFRVRIKFLRGAMHWPI